MKLNDKLLLIQQITLLCQGNVFFLYLHIGLNNLNKIHIEIFHSEKHINNY